MKKFAAILVVTLFLPAARPWQVMAYEVADHFYLTYTAARLAGLNYVDAVKVASAAVAVDESPGSNPMPSWDNLQQGDGARMLHAQRKLHSFTQSMLVRSPEDEYEVQQNQKALFDKAVQNKDLARLGVFAHFQGDYYAHEEEGVHFKSLLGHAVCFFHNHTEESKQVVMRPLKSLANFEITDAAVQTNAAIANQLEEWHRVDQMGNHPEDNRRMLKALYFSIQKFATETGSELQPVERKVAMDMINHFEARHRGDSGEFLKELNEQLKTAGIVAPAYRSRTGISIDVDGNPVELHVTADSLMRDNLQPLPIGPREERVLDRNMYEVATSDNVVTGLPLSPEQGMQLDAMGSIMNEKGVRIRYEAGKLRDAVANARWKIDNEPDPQADDVLKKVTAEKDALVVPLEGALVGISLARLAGKAESEEARSLGGLERVMGYVIDATGGDIVLLGTRGSAGTPRVTFDDLIIALAHVWKRGEFPLCSLDPKPGQAIEAGFLTRVEGVPKNSRFGRVMLDADYSMKRIHMGLDRLKIEDFKTVYDYQLEQMTVGAVEGQQGEGHISRFWLTPIQPVPGDIRVSKGGRIVLFASHVQVLTEVMLMAEDGLVGTHRMDPAEEKGCLEFSRFYPEIAAMRGDFADLQALFDLTLMTGLLREEVPVCPLLDRLAERATSPDMVQDEKYSVLKADLAGRPFVVGGVEAVFSGMHDGIAPLDGRSNLQTLTAELAQSRDPEATRRPRDKFFIEAIKTMWEGQGHMEKADAAAAMQSFQEAEALLGKALDDDPSYGAAYLLRAYLRIDCQLDVTRGIEDCDAVLVWRPGLKRAHSYRGRGEMLLGLQAGSEAERAAKFKSAVNSLNIALDAYPDDEQSHGARGMVRLGQALTSPVLTYNFNSLTISFLALNDRERELIGEAEADFDGAARAGKEPAAAAQWRAMKGWTLTLLGSPAAAREALAEGVNSNNPVSLMYRAAADLAARDYTSSGRYATAAIERTKNSIAMPYEIRAAARFAQHDFQGALKDLEIAVGIDPSKARQDAGIMENLRALQ